MAATEKVSWKSDISATDYIGETFTDPNFSFQRDNALRCCYEGLKSLPEGLKILDYGTGPSLHETVLTAAKASDLVLSDYSAENREALQLWLEKDPAAFDWVPYFRRAVTELEGGEEREVLERVEKIRRVVKAVIHCDLSQDPPVEKGYDVQYDLINSCFCLCVAAKSLEEYRQGIVKLSKLLKPGGVLMMYESEHRECQRTSYFIKDFKGTYVAVTSEFVLKAFRDAGFVEVTVRTVEMDETHPFRVLRPERVGYFHIRGVKKM